jgi:cytochrome o ubiquinol oxidase subunit 2
VLLHPDGDVARQQSDIMISTTIIIAIIIVPVLIAIALVAWRYRASNKRARHDPDWDHSPQLELLVWAGPLLIIIAVGAISWIGTHKTDPYSALHRLSRDKPLPAKGEPIQIDVVSMRWKWLFFYPQYGIATVNELASPVDRPIRFNLTSSDMMDSFFVPDLAGMIYTMPGMQTKLNAVINKPGTYKGMSANYSGRGFTDMRFAFYGMSKADFRNWVAKVRASGHALDAAAYGRLHQPQRDVPVAYYAHFAPDLYQRILERCVVPGQVCMSDEMAGARPHGKRGMSGMPAPSDGQVTTSAPSSQPASAPGAANR